MTSSKYLLLISTLFTQLMASDYIEVYSAYSNGKRVVVEGRVIDSKDKKSSTSKVAGAFFNSEKKNVAISFKLNSQKFEGKSDNEGYFLFDVTSSKVLSSKQSIVLQTEDESSKQSRVLFQPSSKAHIGVISDFDDTVIVSNVTQKTKLLYDTFFTNYKKREVVSEVEKQIKNIVKENKLSTDTALFFVTGSPYQLQNNINLFLDHHDFASRGVLTKKLHGANSDSLFASVAYKYDKIVKLIKMYPQVTWVFFGDSGEKDPEIYLKVLKNFPKSISAVYIRDVESKKVENLKNEIAPFSTDGCSYFPNGTLKNNETWLNCCEEHDKSYWKGGTKAERKSADQKLKTCVNNVGFPKIAKMMYFGVRVGGSAKYDTSYKWGYGWKINRHDFSLNAEELGQVKRAKSVK